TGDTGSGSGTSGTGGAIVAGGPADTAGLKDGDIITELDGQRIDATHSLDDVLILHQPGDTITVTVLRNGATVNVTLKLGTRPAGLQ
ncbi:MAG: PDZ domain-containing protein, partial [Candidatus Limnocylindrales bacterium]